MNNVRFRTVLLVVVLAAVITFILQNWTSVEMKILGPKLSLPLGVLALVCYVLGMLSGWAVFSWVGRSLRAVTDRRNDARTPH